MSDYVTFDPFLHEYTSVYGETVISVTQLLQKHGISPDYSAVPKALLAQSAEIGTKRHEMLQRAIESQGADIADDPAIKWFMANIYPKYTDWHCEQMVWIDGISNPIPVAGHIDIWAKDPVTGRYIIIDFKTTSSFHYDSVAWQDTIYRKLWAFTNNLPEEEADIAGFHAPNKGDCKWIDLNPVPQEELDSLMEAESKGVLYARKTDMVLSTGNQALVAEFEARILELKEIEGYYKQFKEELYEKMVEGGVTEIETAQLKISIVRPSTRTSFDSTKFKEDHADMYDQYVKTSQVKGSVRVKTKEQA